MKVFLFVSSLLILLLSCKEKPAGAQAASVIAEGQMPNLAKDESGQIHLVYGYGDSIMYAWSDNHGSTFSAPVMVGVLPKLAASHMRGPQIAVSQSGVTIIACNTFGDIFSYTKDESGQWHAGPKVNDVEEVAKEGLMALGGDGRLLYAIWLDLRGDKHNKIVGARSQDGGKSWSKNILVYVSPDSSVCECCKPSVAVKGNEVFVMFRNWLNGNRDLYLVKSANAGTSFEPAQKLGMGNWALNGCPMDGGGFVINTNNKVETIWNRRGRLYACEPGQLETEVGSGKNCTIEAVNGNTVYAWTDNGQVIVRKPGGLTINLGKGDLPVIKDNKNGQVLCVWESDKQIQYALVDL